MSAKNVGGRVVVATDSFPHSAPRGTLGTLVEVTTANTPPVPYYIVRCGPHRIGFYADEIALLPNEGVRS